MTVPPQFHMPGAFHAEGVHPGLFRPPISPSSSTSLSYATARPATYDVHSTRKRHRDEISRSQDDLHGHELDADGFFGTPAQVDSRYYLAGQLDTPNGGPVESGILGESMYSDSDYRRVLGSKRPRDELDRSMTGPTPLFNLPPQPTPSKGWGTFAFNTIGGVVGKVWEFCKTGAFRGFYAGGGRGFDMSPGLQEHPAFEDEKPLEGQHIPGRFPFSEEQQQFYSEDQYSMNQSGPEPEEQIDSGASTPTGPATKRRHTDRVDDLGRNWVMVGETSLDRGTPQRRSFRPSPRSRNHGPSMATGRRISVPSSRLSSTPVSNNRRPSSRLSYASSPPVAPPRPSTASFASPRSTSPTKIPQPANTNRRRSAVTHSPTPSFSHRRTHSGASTASARGPVEASPRLNAEAKHLAARRKAEDREADVRMSALNKQLQDMIRQGKEALGTTFEVEGNWDDED